MGHTDSPQGAASPESHVLDEWLRDAGHRDSADAVADSGWQESFKGLVLRHLDVSLQRLRRAQRVQAWLAYMTAGTALLGCSGLALASFGTVFAAEPGEIALPFGLPHSVLRFIPILIATLPAFVFIRLHRVASAYVASRQRELVNDEARYLAYASAVASGREDLLDRAIEALLSAGQDAGPGQDGATGTGEPSPSGVLAPLIRKCLGFLFGR
jgi:hypothetical protein